MKWLVPLVSLLCGLALGVFLADDSGRDSEGGTEVSPASGEPDWSGAGGSGDPAKAPDEPAGAGEAPGAEFAGPIDGDWLASLDGLSDFEQIGVLHARLRGLSTAEFPEVLDSLEVHAGNTLGWQVRAMIAARWGEVDPQGLRTYLESQPRQMRWGLQGALYSSWAKNDAAAALVAAEQLQPNRRRHAVSAIASAVAEKDPQRALRILQEHTDSGGNLRWQYQNMFRTWASRDQDAAMAAAYALEDKAARSSALVGAMSDLIHEDPNAAIQWLDEQEADPLIEQTRQSVLNQILSEDVDAVLSYVERQVDPYERKQLVAGLHFGQLAWSQDLEKVDEVVEWLGSAATGQTYAHKMGDLMRVVAEMDPDRAVERALNLSPGQTRLRSVSAVANVLVRQDLDAAMHFFGQLEFEDEKRRVFQNVSWQLAQNHPERAKELMRTTDDPMIQEQLAQSLSQKISTHEREEALAWAAEVPNEDAKRNVIRGVVQNWVLSDPQAAFDYIGTLAEAGESNAARYYQDALNNYFREDPASAADWLARLDSQGALGDEAERIYQNAANTYVRFDPMAASEWIATLEPGGNRDGAVGSLVRQIHQSDPEAGFAWASTIEDERSRRRNLERSVLSWVKVDSDAAVEAINDASIDASEKERLFDKVPGTE